MTSTDHNILKQDRSKQKSGYARAGLFTILAGGCTVLAATGSTQGLFRHVGIAPDTSDLILGIGTGMSLAAAALTFWLAKFHSGDGSPNRIDESQSRQRGILMAITIFILGFGGVAIFNPFHNKGATELDFSIEFALLAITVAAAATFGVGFVRRRYRLAADDEIMRLIRSRAAHLGYMLAIVGLSATYVLRQVRPDLTAVALPVALLVGAIAPAVYFLVAERRASNDA
jgi:hypothetical protein